MDVGTHAGLFANAAVSTAVTFFSTAELCAFLGCFFGSSHLLAVGLVVCATQVDAAMGAATTSAAIPDANGGGSVSRTKKDFQLPSSGGTLLSAPKGCHAEGMCSV